MRKQWFIAKRASDGKRELGTDSGAVGVGTSKAFSFPVPQFLRLPQDSGDREDWGAWPDASYPNVSGP